MRNPDDRDDIEDIESPLVGDGGSNDELGWEAPTRPDRPLAPRNDAGNASGRQQPQGDDFERDRSRVERDRSRRETD